MTTGAEQGEIAEVGSPVMVPADPAVDRRHAWRWTTIAIGIAAALLALCNAVALTGWLDERTPTATTERLRAPIEQWQRTTAALHLDALRTRMHRWWDAARAARFGDEHPGEPGAG
ncbi:hypothetical protein [Sphingomonas sp. CLY1604]|uniref:hypothetical protein n=1 Tax=Sphingomonas sp. CLY1604 TaxID=3457786 RepID=UPI003FD7E3F6